MGEGFRTRSKGSITSASGGSTLLTYCNGSTTPGGPYGQGYDIGSTQVLTDYVVKDFQRRVADGEIFCHPLHSIKESRGGNNACNYTITYNPTCSGLTLKKQEGIQHRRSLTPSLSYCPSYDYTFEMANARLIAGTQAKAGVIEPDWQGSLLAAELGKTLRTFGRPLENLKKLLNDIRGSNKYRASKVTSLGEFISKEWLRYRYGICTTLHDLEDLAKLAETPVRPLRQTSRGKYESTNEPTNVVLPYDETFFSGNFVYSTKYLMSVRSGVLYEHKMTLLDRAGYGLHNIPSVAWELVPYSFVVDWLFNFGDLIEAVTPKVGVKVLAEWTASTVTVQKRCVASATKKTVANYSITGSLFIESWALSEDKVRVPAIDVGPAINFIEFTLEKSKWQKRTADSIALILTMLSRR